MGKFKLERLNDVEVKEQYQVKVWNRFTTLENLYYDYKLDINRECESTRDNINISAAHNLRYYELKQHKSRFYEVLKFICSNEAGWIAMVAKSKPNIRR